MDPSQILQILSSIATVVALVILFWQIDSARRDASASRNLAVVLDLSESFRSRWESKWRDSLPKIEKIKSTQHEILDEDSKQLCKQLLNMLNWIDWCGRILHWMEQRPKGLHLHRHDTSAQTILFESVGEQLKQIIEVGHSKLQDDKRQHGSDHWVGVDKVAEKLQEMKRKPRHTSVTHICRQSGGIGEDHGTRLSYFYAVYGQLRAGLGLIFSPPRVQKYVKEQWRGFMKRYQPVNTENRTAELELRQRELETRLREAELRVGLARTGLYGTLIGALVGLIMVVVLAGISAFSGQAQITGTQLCIIVGILAVTVALYGAFVFQRSLSIKGSLKHQSFSTSTDGSAQEKENQIPKEDLSNDRL